jgi:hypothetical protein
MDGSTDNVLEDLDAADDIEADDKKRPPSNPSVLRIMIVCNYAYVFNWVNM